MIDFFSKMKNNNLGFKKRKKKKIKNKKIVVLWFHECIEKCVLEKFPTQVYVLSSKADMFFNGFVYYYYVIIIMYIFFLTMQKLTCSWPKTWLFFFHT